VSLFPLEEPDDEVRLQRFYDRLAARFGLHPARVRLSRRKLTGGEIVYGPPHRITISAHLPPAEREETLRHEAAHAWAFRARGARGADDGRPGELPKAARDRVPLRRVRWNLPARPAVPRPPRLPRLPPRGPPFAPPENEEPGP
jgi:hypothetical protein